MGAGHQLGVLVHFGNRIGFFQRNPRFLGDLFQQGRPAQPDQQTLVRRTVFFQSLAHFAAHAVGTGLHGHGLDHALPGRFFRISFRSHGLPEGQIALLDKVHQQHAVAHIFSCQRNDLWKHFSHGVPFRLGKFL